MDPRIPRDDAAAQISVGGGSPSTNRRRERARSASSSTFTWIGVSSSPSAGDLASLNGNGGARKSSKARDALASDDEDDVNHAEDDDHLRSSSTPMILASRMPQAAGTAATFSPATTATATTPPMMGGSGGRRSGSSGRSSSVGLSFSHYQPAQPYPASAFIEHRSASAALPYAAPQRLSDISESEDDTFEDDSPRSGTPPRSRVSSRSKRGGALQHSTRSGSAEASSGSNAQNQFFSRWKLNKSVIPPEIQAYTDQVRRQHLIIDDSRDGTGSANSASSPSPRSPVRSSSKHAAHPRNKADGPSRAVLPAQQPESAPGPPRFPPGSSGPRTSSLPHQVYLQYAATFGTPMPAQQRQSSSPSSPRASSVVATPSWGFSQNPFFPHQFPASPNASGIPKSEFLLPPFGPTVYPGPMGPTFIGSPPFQAASMVPAPRSLPYPHPYALPSPQLPMPAPSSLHGPPRAHSQHAILSTTSVPAHTSATSPRTSSTVFSPFGAPAPANEASLESNSSSLEALMKEKLFTLADVASHSHHVPTPSERMDVSDDAGSEGDEDDGFPTSRVVDDEDDDNRSGGSRMQL